MSSMFETLRARSHGYGIMCDEDELYAIGQKFNTAPVTLQVRNFCNPEQVTRVEVHVPGLPNDRGAYASQVDIYGLFPQLKEWCERSLVHDSIRALSFIESGEEIATILGREVRVLHQWGSGNPDEASFKPYGPFVPKNA